MKTQRSDTTQVEAVRSAVAPVLAALGLDLYDVQIVAESGARTVRVTLTRPEGVDLEVVTEATRALSPVLDDLSGPGLNGSYVLEVSSPGVERSLRRPEHYLGALGEAVVVKFHTDAGPRRVHGTLASADATSAEDGGGFVVQEDGTDLAIAYAAVTSAHTVFEWGPQPRPGAPAKGGARAKGGAPGRAKERS